MKTHSKHIIFFAFFLILITLGIYFIIVNNYSIRSKAGINNRSSDAYANKKYDSTKHASPIHSVTNRELELLAISWIRNPFNRTSFKGHKHAKSQDQNERYLLEKDKIEKKENFSKIKKKHSLPSKNTRENVRQDNEIRGLSNLELTGIVYFDNEYIALINDLSVREGDMILDYKVYEIRSNCVIVKDNSGKNYLVELE